MLLVSDELEREGKAFWGGGIIRLNEPFNSLMRYQILLQFKNQLNLDPLEWKIDQIHGSGEGHWLPVKAGNVDRVENFSAHIVNQKTGERKSFWVDWISSCEEESEERYKNCQHNIPEDCGIRFFNVLLGDEWYDPEGKKFDEPFHSRRWHEMIDK